MEENEGGILAQRPRLRLLERHRRFALGAAAVMLFGVVTAVATVSDAPQPEALHAETVDQPLTLPGTLASTPAPADFWREEQYRAGDTFAALLARLGVAAPDIQQILRDQRNAPVLRALRPGMNVSAHTDEGGSLLSLRFLSGKSLLGFEKEGSHFARVDEPADLVRTVVVRNAEIKTSLFAAVDEAGIPDNVAAQLADVFDGEVDFRRDLRRGDRFTVAYEMYFNQGHPVRSGRVLGAEFSSGKRTLRAVWFELAEGHGSYFTPDGANLRKTFLRSPLPFSRVTSGFAMRFHPILKEWRQHFGTDFGAPSGTPVRATSDGIVDFAGWEGGYGRLIILRHAGGIQTYYAHLSGFAKETMRGARVSQGEVIGYVGQTGWATGPHLHYEFHVHGVQHDPLKVALPSAEPVPKAQYAAFRGATAEISAQLALVSGTSQVAALE